MLFGCLRRNWEWSSVIGEKGPVWSGVFLIVLQNRVDWVRIGLTGWFRLRGVLEVSPTFQNSSILQNSWVFRVFSKILEHAEYFAIALAETDWGWLAERWVEVSRSATEETDCDAHNFAQLVLTQISDSHLPPKLNSSNVNMQPRNPQYFSLFSYLTSYILILLVTTYIIFA